LPPPSNCQEQGDCTPASSPLEWQYATSSGSDTVLSIGTEYDPNIPDAQAISSQTSSQYGSQTDPYGSFFCDNGPANPCGIEVMDLGVDSGNVIADC
jgi:hypothetical protein